MPINFSDLKTRLLRRKNKYESGVIKPVRKLNELALLFGVTADYILCFDEKLGTENAANPHDHNQVKKYLSLSDDGKEIVDIMLNAIYEREKNCRRISSPPTVIVANEFPKKLT